MTDQETLARFEAMVDLRPETRAFLRDWLEWVERGAPEGEPYWRENGLCDNAFKSRAGCFVLGDLESAFDDDSYPFGCGDFHRRYHDRTMHECPKRLAFARANAAGAV